MNWLANDDNPEYHRRVTGPAIVQSIARQNQSLVDAITIGVGSAGTVTGVGETIKAWTNDVRIVAVEPYENQVLGGGLTGPHGIPDIGYGIVPENYNSYVVDNVSAVASRDAPACRPAGAAHRCDSRLRSAPVLPCTPPPSCWLTATARAAAGHFQRTRQHRVSGLLLSIGKRTFFHDQGHDQRCYYAVADQIYHSAGAGQPVPA